MTFGFESMNSRVIIGSWKITAPLYVPLMNVDVNRLLLGGGCSSGVRISTQCTPICGIATRGDGENANAGMNSSAGTLADFVMMVGSLGTIASRSATAIL